VMFRHLKIIIGNLFTLLTGLLVILPTGNSVFASDLPACPSDTSAYFHNCFGTFTYADGGKYVGEFKDDKQNGQGTYTSANGDKYVGEFKDDKRNGQGTYTSANGEKYVGEWKDNKFQEELADSVLSDDLRNFYAKQAPKSKAFSGVICHSNAVSKSECIGLGNTGGFKEYSILKLIYGSNWKPKNFYMYDVVIKGKKNLEDVFVVDTRKRQKQLTERMSVIRSWQESIDMSFKTWDESDGKVYDGWQHIDFALYEPKSEHEFYLTCVVLPPGGRLQAIKEIFGSRKDFNWATEKSPICVNSLSNEDFNGFVIVWLMSDKIGGKQDNIWPGDVLLVKGTLSRVFDHSNTYGQRTYSLIEFNDVERKVLLEDFVGFYPGKLPIVTKAGAPYAFDQD